jgi:hypothetical protein
MTKTKKKNIKVRDLKPKKDAKGGTGRLTGVNTGANTGVNTGVNTGANTGVNH